MRKLNIFVLSTSMMLAFSQMVLGDNIPSFKITIPGKSSEFDKDKALAEINKWRKEAIDNDYFGFKSIHKKEFVEIKWRPDLEEVAKLRSAEASILPEHRKLDGAKPKRGEVLAWNGNGSINGALHSWYGEKTKFYDVNPEKYNEASKNNKVNAEDTPEIGHYYVLVNPDTKYIGLAGYSLADYIRIANPGTPPWSAVAGSFSAYEKIVDINPISDVSKVDFNVGGGNVDNLSVSNLSIEVPEVMGINDTARVNANIYLNSEYSGEWIANTPIVFDKSKWSSSNNDIIRIENDGTLTPLREGKSKIKINLGDGLSIEKEITVQGEKATVNQLYPGLIPIKNDAEKEIMKLNGLTEPAKNKIKEEIINATSRRVINQIVENAKIVEANERKIIAAKEKIVQDLNNELFLAKMMNPEKSKEIENYINNLESYSIDKLNKISEEILKKPIDEKLIPKLEAVPEVTDITNDIIKDPTALLPAESTTPIGNPDTTPSPGAGDTGSSGSNPSSGVETGPVVTPPIGNVETGGSDKDSNTDSGSAISPTEPSQTVVVPKDENQGGSGTSETNPSGEPGSSSSEGTNSGSESSSTTGPSEGTPVTPTQPGTDGSSISTPTQPDTKPVDPAVEKAQIEARKAALEKDLERIYKERRVLGIAKLLLQQQFEIENSRLNNLANKSETGVWATLDNNQLKHKDDSINTNGVTAGYDVKLGNTTVGVLGSYGAGKVKGKSFDDKNETFTTGAYGVHRIGNFYGAALLDYQSTRVKGMKRFTGGNATIQSGYTFKLKNNISVSPQLDLGFGSTKAKEIDRVLTSRSAGATLNIDYTPTSVLKVGASLGAHKVRISNAGVNRIDVVDMDKVIYEVKEENLGAKTDTHYNVSVNVGAQITPLFSVEGNVGYSKYQKAKLSGVSYGVQVNYKF